VADDGGIEVFMQKCAQILKNADKMALLPHIKPDGDTLGSAFALCAALRKMGKMCYVVTDYDIVGKLAVLLENNDYHTKDCGGFETAVAIDTADRALLGRCDAAFPKIDLSIDHHKSNKNFAAYTWMDVMAAATGELVYDLINELGVEIDEYIARALYIAISTDTGCFRYANTTARTFLIASHISGMFTGRDKLNLSLFSQKSKRKIELEGYAAGKMRFFEDDKIALILLDSRSLEGVSEDDFEGISQIGVSVEGVEVGIVARQQDETEWRISMRSNEYVDVSAICAFFGGGGHSRASGCTVVGDIEEAAQKMIEMIKERIK